MKKYPFAPGVLQRYPRRRRACSVGRIVLALAVLTALMASGLLCVSGIFAGLIYRFL